MAINSNQDQLKNMGRDKLRALARLIHLQEAERIKTVGFQSEYHRAQYLRESRDAYQLSIHLLDAGEEAARVHKDDQVTASLAHEFFDYTHYAVGAAVRVVWNLSLRKSYLQKLCTFADEKQVELFNLMRGHGTAAEIEEASRQLAQDLAANKHVVLEFMESRETPNSRSFSKGFKAWRQRKTPGITTFEHMVAKYQKKLGKTPGRVGEYAGNFENLEMQKRTQVYLEMINSSGKGGRMTNMVAKGLRGAGAALILFQLGFMAWDIYTSDHKWETATKDGLELAFSVGAGIAGEAIGVAAATAVCTAVGITATTVGVLGVAGATFVCLAGLATGIGAAIAVGFAVGWLVDKLFESGGKEAEIKKYVDVRHPSSTEKLTHYVMPMPNAQRLALRLNY